MQAGVGAPPDQEPAPTATLADLRGPGADRLREMTELLNSVEQIQAQRESGGGREAGRLLLSAQRALEVLGITGVDLTAGLRRERR